MVVFVYLTWVSKYHSMVWAALHQYQPIKFGYTKAKHNRNKSDGHTYDAESIDATNKLTALIDYFRKRSNKNKVFFCIFAENEALRWDADSVLVGLEPEKTPKELWQELNAILAQHSMTLRDLNFSGKKGLLTRQIKQEAYLYMQSIETSPNNKKKGEVHGHT